MSKERDTPDTNEENTKNSDGVVYDNKMNTTSDKPGMTVEELDSVLFDCADNLRGNVSKEKYKNYISPLLFLYAIDARYNKQLEKAKEEGIPEKLQDNFAKGGVGYELPESPTAEDITEATNDIAGVVDSWFKEFENLNGIDLLDKRYSAEESLDDSVMLGLVNEIRSIDFENTPPDLLGESYMNLMKRFAHEEGGEYFTPPKYSNLLARTAYTLTDGFDINSSFHDPTSGSSGLLIEAASLIRDDPEGRQDTTVDDLSETDVKFNFTGQELDPQIHKLGIMNTALHGMDKVDLKRADSLSEPQFTDDEELKDFDYILANPPFSQNWNKQELQDDVYGRFDWNEKLPRANRGDYAFIMHMLAHASDTGIVSTVVPHGVLYRSGEQRYRDYLLNNDYVEAVISLPGKLFESTSAPTAILILNKNKPKEHNKEVMFINADIEGRFYYDTGSSRNELLDEGVDEICELLDDWREEESVSRIVDIEDINEFDNNLTISLYVDTTEPQPEIDIGEIHKQHEQILEECVQLNDQIQTKIEALEL